VQYVTPSPVARSELAVRADCQDQASRAWPYDTAPSQDPTMSQIGSSYTSYQRERAFQQCMADNGYPQQ
jgi:hypothetical protein